MKKYGFWIFLACLMCGCGDDNGLSNDKACDPVVCKAQGGVCQNDQCVSNVTCNAAACAQKGGTCQNDSCVIPPASCDAAVCAQKGGACQNNICLLTPSCDEAVCAQKGGTCQNGSCVITESKCGTAECAQKGGTCQGDTCVVQTTTCDETKCTQRGGTCIDNACVVPKICGDTTCTNDETCFQKTCMKTAELCGTPSTHFEVCSRNESCFLNECVPWNLVCGQKLCDPTETCLENRCVPADTLCENKTKTCNADQKCVDDQCVALSELCGGKTKCGTNQKCVNNECVEDKPNPTGLCGGIQCADGYTCTDNLCKKPDGTLQGGRCGYQFCPSTQVCINGTCTDRTPKGTPDEHCNLETFIEYCDKNKAVYCAYGINKDGEQDTIVTISDCESDECAERAEANFTYCTHPDARCTPQTGGQLTYCKLETEPDGTPITGAISYLDIFDCRPDTHGVYRVFRDVNNNTEDCISTCKDEFTCLEEVEGTKDYCDGRLAYQCDKDSCFPLNCDEYGLDCLIDGEGQANCDWDKCEMTPKCMGLE